MVTSTGNRRLLAAAFTGILATGVGFAVRGGILANWGTEFGFTGAELGAISGAGFTGFTFGIIAGGLVCDQLGYGKLIAAAFTLHLLSALITFLPAEAAAKATAHLYLFWGTFVFGLANGALESAVNPLVATLYPEDRSHYLNVLHAGWPSGLILGGFIGWLLGDEMHIRWQIQLSLFLVPTLVYGFLFLREPIPRSEVAMRGLRFGETLSEVGLLGGTLICALLALFADGLFRGGTTIVATSAIASLALLTAVGAATRFSLGSFALCVLFIAHALVGTVELGTDGWIQNITGSLLTPAEGKILFIVTALTVLLLRFSVRLLERRLQVTPLAILLGCSIVACVGLNLVSIVTSFQSALVALIVYAMGKSFLWPTMLAVTADRFPRSGAVAISMMGGIGYLAAGVIGSPGLGYAKDRFIAEDLQRRSPIVYQAYKADEPSRFLWFAPVYGLDGKKFAVLTEESASAREQTPPSEGKDSGKAARHLSSTQRTVLEAEANANRRTLKADATIPIAMALIYLVLLFSWVRKTPRPRPPSDHEQREAVALRYSS